MTDVFLYSLLTVTSLAVACGVLSVLVVLRRWAFIGEGISHSAWGGAGTVWLLALFFPAFDAPGAPYVAVVAFSLATAVLIGWLSRTQVVSMDATIGIFLVASLAWGFMAQQIYLAQKHSTPVLFESLLFGRMLDTTLASALMSLGICAAVVLAVWALGKEIVAYCFDPLTAQTSGVPTAMIHYLLLVLIAVVIVVGVRVAGSVLVTALLVLPGAAALLCGKRMRLVLAASVIISLLGTVSGLLIHMGWRVVPVGPAIVLALLAQFVGCFAFSRLRRA